jgi:hypothetical protein
LDWDSPFRPCPNVASLGSIGYNQGLPNPSLENQIYLQKFKAMQPTTNRPIERRKFLSLAASASTLAASCAKSSGGFAGSVHPSWASERIRVGAIGVGGRGALLLEQLPVSAQIVAAADCNEPRALAIPKPTACLPASVARDSNFRRKSMTCHPDSRCCAGESTTERWR